MIKKSTSKVGRLTFNKDTLRNMNEGALRQVAGGGQTNSCTDLGKCSVKSDWCSGQCPKEM